MEPKHGDAIMMLEPKTYTSVSRNVLTAYIMMKVSTTTITTLSQFFTSIGLMVTKQRSHQCLPWLRFESFHAKNPSQ